ncbi:hypothetical protein Y025_5617 [Burkholderia pseudomallei TSV32]|nr:hypothetical protein Y025_5617 [Burkholderia pseudomallei TSV32]
MRQRERAKTLAARRRVGGRAGRPIAAVRGVRAMFVDRPAELTHVASPRCAAARRPLASDARRRSRRACAQASLPPVDPVYSRDPRPETKNKVHRGIPGNAARILRKKYCSSRYP